MQTTNRLHEMLEDAPSHFKLQPRSSILPEGYQPEKLCYKFAVTDTPPNAASDTDAAAENTCSGAKAGMTFMSRILAERKASEAYAVQCDASGSGGAADDRIRGVMEGGDGSLEEDDGGPSIWQQFTREGQSRGGHNAPLAASSGAAGSGNAGAHCASAGASVGNVQRILTEMRAQDALDEQEALEDAYNEEEELAALGGTAAAAAAPQAPMHHPAADEPRECTDGGGNPYDEGDVFMVPPYEPTHQQQQEWCEHLSLIHISEPTRPY